MSREFSNIFEFNDLYVVVEIDQLICCSDLMVVVEGYGVYESVFRYILLEISHEKEYPLLGRVRGNTTLSSMYWFGGHPIPVRIFQWLFV